MSYRFSQASSKLQTAEAGVAYGPQAIAKGVPSSEPTLRIPPYKPAGYFSLDGPNRVKFFQQLFRVGGSDLPVYVRRGSREILLYRGIMVGSLVGIGITFYAIYSMATGRMKKES